MRRRAAKTKHGLFDVAADNTKAGPLQQANQQPAGGRGEVLGIVDKHNAPGMGELVLQHLTHQL